MTENNITAWLARTVKHGTSFVCLIDEENIDINSVYRN